MLPLCHRVASLLKRWLIGTHQGGISHEHLNYYLERKRTKAKIGRTQYAVVTSSKGIPPINLLWTQQVEQVVKRKKILPIVFLYCPAQ